MRYNLFRSAQINGTAAPGYRSDQATRALEARPTDTDGQPDSGRKTGRGMTSCRPGITLRAPKHFRLTREEGIISR
jgi:hypothetical protein